MLEYALILIGLIGCAIILTWFSVNHKNYPERNLDFDYFFVICRNLSISFVVGSILLMFRDTFFNTMAMPKLKNIIFILLFIDTLYYFMHRTIHRTPVLRKLFHETHHEAIKLVPIDVFYLGLYDYILYLVVTAFTPILFVEGNVIEYVTIILISMFHSILIHSDIDDEISIPGFIDSRFHTLHHTIGGGNYSIFFSLWDSFMNTVIAENKTEEKTPDK